MQRYRVSGTQSVREHRPGHEFLAAFTDIEERYFLGGGHLTLVDATPGASDGGGDADKTDARKTGGGDQHSRRRRAHNTSKEAQD